MRAAVLHGPEDLRIEEVPVPEPGPGELLLRVETVGICGSDLSEFNHGPVLSSLRESHHVTGHVGPLVLGHEFSGVVETSRSDVFEAGELVACAAAVSCGQCRYCVSGRMSVCEDYWVVGLHRNGGLAEFCPVPATTCISADGLTPDLAALAQPMSIAVHAVRQSRLTPEEQVIVVGAGGIGAFITHVAAASGAVVVACDVDPGRLEVADHLGAEHTVQIGPATELIDEVNRLGVVGEVIFEATGTSGGLALAESVLVPGSRLVAVGMQVEQTEVDLRRLTLREHEIIGTNGLDIPTDLPTAVQLLGRTPGLWAELAPVVATLEGLVENGLRSQYSPQPIKTLVSPAGERERESRML